MVKMNVRGGALPEYWWRAHSGLCRLRALYTFNIVYFEHSTAVALSHILRSEGHNVSLVCRRATAHIIRSNFASVT